MTKNYKELGSLVTIKGGGTPSRKIESYWCGEIPWATVKDFNKSHYLNNTIEKITEEGLKNSASNLIPKGYIIMPTRMALGKAMITTMPTAINQDIKALIPNEKISTKYLLHFLLSYSKKIEKMGKGATVKGITLNQLKEIKIPLPPLEEQKRIAAILDKAEELRQKRQKAIQLLDDLLEATFLDMFGDPVTNPKSWPTGPTISKTTCIVPGRDKPKSFTGNTPWIKTDDLINLGITMNSNKKLALTKEEINEVKAKIIPKNAVIITCVGDLGICSIAGQEMVINQQLHAFILNDKTLLPQFLLFALSYQKNYMKKMASTTTVPYMNKTIANSIPCTFPPISLQNIFRKIFSNIYKQKNDMIENMIKNEILFNSIQQNAFKGKI